jgi:light-regulated signal transduction histidine kinase (bacteriophytochrome)
VDGGERMKKLIHDLLEYSRVGVNKDDYAEIDLNLLIYYVTGLFKENIAGAELIIHELPVINGRKAQFTQLFQNLLSNSIKYRGKEPLRIEIGCVEKKEEWEFFIRDNGIGIDPKFNEKIFIIFQRLHNRSEYAGTGIGLSICKKIVERHGGKMWVESSLGEGSAFRFTLPK